MKNKVHKNESIEAKFLYQAYAKISNTLPAELKFVHCSKNKIITKNCKIDLDSDTSSKLV